MQVADGVRHTVLMVVAPVRAGRQRRQVASNAVVRVESARACFVIGPRN
jgi:hypothetical protein